MAEQEEQEAEQQYVNIDEDWEAYASVKERSKQPLQNKEFWMPNSTCAVTNSHWYMWQPPPATAAGTWAQHITTRVSPPVISYENLGRRFCKDAVIGSECQPRHFGTVSFVYCPNCGLCTVSDAKWADWVHTHDVVMPATKEELRRPQQQQPTAAFSSAANNSTTK